MFSSSSLSCSLSWSILTWASIGGQGSEPEVACLSSFCGIWIEVVRQESELLRSGVHLLRSVVQCPAPFCTLRSVS